MLISLIFTEISEDMAKDGGDGREGGDGGDGREGEEKEKTV